jgi:hypothetical protein
LEIAVAVEPDTLEGVAESVVADVQFVNADEVE